MKKYITNKKILNRVAEEFGVDPLMMSARTKANQVAQARSAFMLIVHLLDGDIENAKESISNGATPYTYYLEKAIDFYEYFPEFRLIVDTILKYYDNDILIEFSSRYTYKGLNKDTRTIARNTAKSADNQASEHDKGGRLFYFTAEEEEAIARARREIPIWFEKKYGHGQKPKEYLWT
jgi:hypothetical protein